MQRKSVEVINLNGFNLSRLENLQSFMNMIEEEDIDMDETD